MLPDDGVVGVDPDVDLHPWNFTARYGVVAQGERDVVVGVVGHLHVLEVGQGPKGRELATLARRKAVFVGVTRNGFCPDADAFFGRAVDRVEVLHRPERRLSCASFTIGISQNRALRHLDPLADAHHFMDFQGVAAVDVIVVDGVRVDVGEVLNDPRFGTQVLLHKVEHGPFVVIGVKLVVFGVEVQGVAGHINPLGFHVDQHAVHWSAHLKGDATTDSTDAGPPPDWVRGGIEEFFGIAASTVDEGTDPVLIQDASCKVLVDEPGDVLRAEDLLPSILIWIGGLIQASVQAVLVDDAIGVDGLVPLDAHLVGVAAFRDKDLIGIAVDLLPGVLDVTQDAHGHRGRVVDLSAQFLFNPVLGRFTGPTAVDQGAVVDFNHIHDAVLVPVGIGPGQGQFRVVRGEDAVIPIPRLRRQQVFPAVVGAEVGHTLVTPLEAQLTAAGGHIGTVVPHESCGAGGHRGTVSGVIQRHLHLQQAFLLRGRLHHKQRIWGRAEVDHIVRLTVTPQGHSAAFGGQDGNGADVQGVATSESDFVSTAVQVSHGDVHHDAVLHDVGTVLQDQGIDDGGQCGVPHVLVHAVFDPHVERSVRFYSIGNTPVGEFILDGIRTGKGDVSLEGTGVLRCRHREGDVDEVGIEVPGLIEAEFGVQVVGVVGQHIRSIAPCPMTGGQVGSGDGDMDGILVEGLVVAFIQVSGSGPCSIEVHHGIVFCSVAGPPSGAVERAQVVCGGDHITFSWTAQGVLSVLG